MVLELSRPLSTPLGATAPDQKCRQGHSFSPSEQLPLAKHQRHCRHPAIGDMQHSSVLLTDRALMPGPVAPSYARAHKLSLGGGSEEISQICAVWAKAVAVSRYQRSPRHSHVRKEARIAAQRGGRPLMSIRTLRSSSALALVPIPPGRLGLACTMIAVTSSRMVANSVGVPRLNSSASSTTARL